MNVKTRMRRQKMKHAKIVRREVSRGILALWAIAATAAKLECKFSGRKLVRARHNTRLVIARYPSSVMPSVTGWDNTPRLMWDDLYLKLSLTEYIIEGKNGNTWWYLWHTDPNDYPIVFWWAAGSKVKQTIWSGVDEVVSEAELIAYWNNRER